MKEIYGVYANYPSWSIEDLNAYCEAENKHIITHKGNLCGIWTNEVYNG